MKKKILMNLYKQKMELKAEKEQFRVTQEMRIKEFLANATETIEDYFNNIKNKNENKTTTK